MVNEGEAIRVEYCNDLSAKDVVFYEAFEEPSVDLIVESINQNFKKYAPQKGKIHLFKQKK